MMIEKLNVTSPITNVTNDVIKADASSFNTRDSVTLSKDAERLAEIHLAMNVAKSAPDIRVDKIAEMKEKFSNPSYLENIISDLADNIMTAYGL